MGIPVFLYFYNLTNIWNTFKLRTPQKVLPCSLHICKLAPVNWIKSHKNYIWQILVPLSLPGGALRVMSEQINIFYHSPAQPSPQHSLRLFLIFSWREGFYLTSHWRWRQKGQTERESVRIYNLHYNQLIIIKLPR